MNKATLLDTLWTAHRGRGERGHMNTTLKLWERGAEQGYDLGHIVTRHLVGYIDKWG